MMYISRNLMGAAHASETQEQKLATLHSLVQTAIEVEHATIPLYLAGYFSTLSGVKEGTSNNEEAADIVRSVVIEEMLHFSIASNLLIALGGSPAIDTKDFIPVYGKKLPFSIGEGVTVDLKPLSRQQIHDVYMKIEEPEHGALDIPERAPMLMVMTEGAGAEEFETIGAFYKHILKLLKELVELDPNSRFPFTENPGLQMLNNRWFPSDELFLIHDYHSAETAVNIILDQGEGTGNTPFEDDDSDEPAHYYRFQEIYKGYRIKKVPPPPPGHPKPKDPFYFDTSDPVPFDETKIVPFKTNPKLADYDPKSPSFARAQRFAWGYASLLRQLHATFNGAPKRIDDVMAQMYQLRIWAINCLETPAVYSNQGLASPGEMTGLCFEYVANSGA